MSPLADLGHRGFAIAEQLLSKQRSAGFSLLTLVGELAKQFRTPGQASPLTKPCKWPNWAASNSCAFRSVKRPLIQGARLTESIMGSGWHPACPPSPTWVPAASANVECASGLSKDRNALFYKNNLLFTYVQMLSVKRALCQGRLPCSGMGTCPRSFKAGKATYLEVEMQALSTIVSVGHCGKCSLPDLQASCGRFRTTGEL